jgi:hypothetical protein
VSALGVGIQTAESRAEAARARRASLVLVGLTIVLAGAYAATLVVFEGEPLLIAPLVGALIGAAVFVRPILGVYLLFAAAILLEQFEITGLSPLTARTHFFENLSGFSTVPVRLSASDMLAIMTLASWGMRRLVGDNAPVRAGPFGWAFAIYGLAFAFGGVIGAARGGGWDSITALAEGRGALYACLLYFLTANLVRERGQLVVLLWELVLLVGMKAFQGIGNFIEVRLNGPYGLEAVTAHEDVIFFNVAISLALLMVALRVRGRLFYVLLFLQPVIVLAELVTTRRVGFAALFADIAVVALLSAVYRPRLTATAAAVGMFVFVLYAAAFWQSEGVLGQPLRVVREFVDPYSVSDRDRGSNYWRDIENANIAYTVRQLPLTGVGLGQEYLFQQEPPPLTTFVYWRYITHNAVLWMWLKAGPYGAFAFWFLMAQVVMFGAQLYRRLDDPLLRAAAALPVVLTVTQVVFSSVDLGLTYNRTMIVFGVVIGLTAPLAAWCTSSRALDRLSPQPVANDGLGGARPRRGLPALVGDMPTSGG